jgi:hypothetical protein
MPLLTILQTLYILSGWHIVFFMTIHTCWCSSYGGARVVGRRELETTVGFWRQPDKPIGFCSWQDFETIPCFRFSTSECLKTMGPKPTLHFAQFLCSQRSGFSPSCVLRLQNGGGHLERGLVWTFVFPAWFGRSFCCSLLPHSIALHHIVQICADLCRRLAGIDGSQAGKSHNPRASKAAMDWFPLFDDIVCL